jgi:hypothetical protein
LTAYGFVTPVNPTSGGNWGWQQSSQGASSVTNTANGFIMKSAGNGTTNDDFRLYGQTISNVFAGSIPTTWTIRFGFNVTATPGSNYLGSGVYLWNSVSAATKMLYFLIDHFGGTVAVGHNADKTHNTSTSYTETSYSQEQSQMVWMFIYYDGTNYNWYLSPDGVTKRFLFQETKLNYLAAIADNIGLMHNANNGSTTPTINTQLFDFAGYSGAP